MPSSVTVSTITALDNTFTDREQWVCWRLDTRDGTHLKVPIKPFPTAHPENRRASHTDPSTWSEFQAALSFHRTTGSETAGIGYVFTADGPFAGIDLDDCRDSETSQIDGWARSIVTRLDSYAEVSPSGTGVHVLVRGSLPPAGRRRGSVEMYDDKRFFTVTGDHLDQTPLAIHARQDALEAVHQEYLQTDDDCDRNSTECDESGRNGLQDEILALDGSSSIPATDDDVVAVRSRAQVADLPDTELIKRAKTADDGGKFDNLWAGRWESYAPSHSEADMMLACKLVFWTGGNPHRVDRLFRQSGLMRDKWDEVHYASGETYGEKTLKRAIDLISDYYVPEGLAVGD